MDRDILKNNALELFKQSNKPSKMFVSNGDILNELKMYRNVYTSIKNRTKEEDKILEDLRKALDVELAKPHYVPDESSFNSETHQSFNFSDSLRDDEER